MCLLKIIVAQLPTLLQLEHIRSSTRFLLSSFRFSLLIVITNTQYFYFRFIACNNAELLTVHCIPEIPKNDKKS